MIKLAVVLAAGMGVRFKEKTIKRPKAFLEINGKTLIERSLDSLLNVGIEKIVVGTGHLEEYFKELKEKYPMLSLVRNDKYYSTGSMATLFNMQSNLKEDFLLLESDLLYHSRALSEIISCKYKDVILASDITDYGDEVFLETDGKKNLVQLSKNKKQLNSIDSVLVGISKVSLDVYRNVCDYYSSVFSRFPKMDYEKAFSNISHINKFYIKKVEGLAWCEIDNAEHFQRAKNLISPLIDGKIEVMEQFDRECIM